MRPEREATHTPKPLNIALTRPIRFRLCGQLFTGQEPLDFNTTSTTRRSV